VVEEIFFRGALYTHLSQLGRAWPTFLRVSFAVVLSSFVFAVVHPQGWLGTLLLMPLAAVFALVREARGSVYPGMVAHMIHNGTICAVILLFLR
jgi:membrane protease YdiL (CAAX protease family)